MNRYLLIPTYVIMILVLIGCSGNGTSPVTPANNLFSQTTGAKSIESQAGGRMLWGLFDVAIDFQSETIEAVPVRGAMFNANVTKFLQPPSSPINLLTININPASDFPNGYLDIDVTIRHPFFGINKFRGFDVRGIVMGDPMDTFSWDTSASRGGSGELELLNADGYTRWWNPSEFTTFDTILGYTQGSYGNPTYLALATVNPYKYFADSLDETAAIETLEIDTRGTFGTEPGINKRNYQIQFPIQPGGPVFHFNYAIDAAWALPNPAFEPDYPVEAFPPEANMQEAWLTVVDDSESTAWYVSDLEKGGMLKLGIEVFDWQVPFTGSTVGEEVLSIWLESVIFDSPIDVTSMVSPEPGGAISSVWTVEIADLNLTESGAIPLWIGVESASPADYEPQISGDTSMFAWPDAALTAFFKTSFDVAGVNPNDPPVVISVNPSFGILSTVETDVEIIGENFMDGAAIEFKNEFDINLTITNTLWQNDTLITCDVDCAGPLGFYDVIVMNPDQQAGTLDDGFEVIETFQCEGSAHGWNDEDHEFNGSFTNTTRNSMAILKAGSRAGQALMQISSTQWGTFDPEGGAGQTVDPFFGTNGMYVEMVTTCETSGRIMFINTFTYKRIDIYDEEGVLLGAFTDPDIASGGICAFDLDRDGDLWTVVFPTGGVKEFEIRHYAFLDDAPWYEYVPEDTIDITGSVFSGAETGWGVGDIGISFTLHRLFIFTSNKSDGGTNVLTSWDLNTSPPEILVTLQNPYPPYLRHHILTSGVTLNRMNVDVDHRFEDIEEQCRVYTFATLYVSGSIDCCILRFDGDLNLMDTGETWSVPYPSQFSRVPQWAVINDYDGTSSANIISSHWSTVGFQNWPAPSDW